MIKFLRVLNYILLVLFSFTTLMLFINAFIKIDYFRIFVDTIFGLCLYFGFISNKGNKNILIISSFFGCFITDLILSILFKPYNLLFTIIGVLTFVFLLIPKIEKHYGKNKVLENAKE